MPLKTCNKCKLALPDTAFYKNAKMKDGLNTFCIDCHKQDNVQRKRSNRANPVFVQAERAAKKEYRDRTTEQRAQYMRAWRTKSKDHVREYGKKYRTENKSFINYLCQKRKIALLHRTPAWLTDDDFWMIEQAYELASLRTETFGFAWHVDHEIPLRGKRVSGLHTPTNLRVIPATVNQRKSNSFEVPSCR